MSDQLLMDRAFINSIVGEGTSFKGELTLQGLLRIDGDFIGRIHTEGKVLIGKNGRAECTIIAGTVVVGGVLKGNIRSTEKVIVLSSGTIIGNVSAPRLIIEDGVIFHGECVITDKPKDTEKDETSSPGSAVSDYSPAPDEPQQTYWKEENNQESYSRSSLETQEFSPWKR